MGKAAIVNSDLHLTPRSTHLHEHKYMSYARTHSNKCLHFANLIMNTRSVDKMTDWSCLPALPLYNFEECLGFFEPQFCCLLEASRAVCTTTHSQRPEPCAQQHTLSVQSRVHSTLSASRAVCTAHSQRPEPRAQHNSQRPEQCAQHNSQRPEQCAQHTLSVQSSVPSRHTTKSQAQLPTF
jgi:hypothetical protein